jgi:hypothetical protein
MNRLSAPTLLVFTLGTSAESARRALLPAGHRALEREVWETCLTAALEAGRACGCALEVCSPARLPLPADVLHAPQSDGLFGARLESALDGAFSRGAGPLLVVGTDVPGFSARSIEQALAALGDDPDRVVLGPSPDGGFYLLACRRPIEGLAGATRWRRRDTLRGLARSLRAAGRPVELLAPLRDLDRPADLELWLAAGSVPRSAAANLCLVLTRIARLLAGLRRPPAPRRAGRRLPAFAAAARGRAPPSSFSAESV